jgi:CBS domain-containing protein
VAYDVIAHLEPEETGGQIMTAGESMTVKEIMSTDIRVVDATSSIQKAAGMMKELDIGFLPAVLANKPAGAVTDRDIVVRGVAAGIDLQATPVGEIMTRNLAVVLEDATVAEAAAQMGEKQIRRLLVLNAEGSMVGVVTLSDLATGFEDSQLAGQTLGKLSESAT